MSIAMQKKRWKARYPGEQPDRQRSLLQRLLQLRGIGDEEVFFNPSLGNLVKPARMPGMERAAERLVEAVRTGQRIVIYGDYDVDGITATAILFQVIRSIAPDADIRSYIPHRLDEGYGLNEEALESIAEDGADLVITVDCGITATDEATRAGQLGFDLVITDHHQLALDPKTGEPLPLPTAHALVHPDLPGSEYPFKELCGAGVAWKLAWQFAVTWCGSEKVADVLREALMQTLPLAGIGTIADVVPLVGENRIIASLGLRRVPASTIPGLRALVDAAGLASKKIDSESIGFRIAPLLNASGRMDHAEDAAKLLIDADDHQCREIASSLVDLNKLRKIQQDHIEEEAIGIIEQSGLLEDEARVIVLAHPDWHRGIVGIVCSRLVERYGRPTILMQEHEGLCMGSARSIDGYPIHEGLTACGTHLKTFGGHAMAAGLTLETTELDRFREALEAHARERLEVEDLVPSIEYDCHADLDELCHMEVARELARMGPFGRSNPRPRFRVSGLEIAMPPKFMGSREEHVALSLRPAGAGASQNMRCVWWRAADHVASMELEPGMRVEAILTPSINSFRGRESVEAQVIDLVRSPQSTDKASSTAAKSVR